MSVVPKAGEAVTFATGGSTTTFELLVVVVEMVLARDGVCFADAEVVVPVEGMAGTETAVDPVELTAREGDADPLFAADPVFVAAPIAVATT